MTATTPPPILQPDPRPGTSLVVNAFGYGYVLRLPDGRRVACWVPKHGRRSCHAAGRWHR